MSSVIVWLRVRTRSRACSSVEIGRSCVPGFASLPLGETKMFHGLSGPASNAGASIDASADDDPPVPPPDPASPPCADPAAPVVDVGAPPDPLAPPALEFEEVDDDEAAVGVPAWFDCEQHSFL